MGSKFFAFRVDPLQNGFVIQETKQEVTISFVKKKCLKIYQVYPVPLSYKQVCPKCVPINLLQY